jgi:hypothetical protein
LRFALSPARKKCRHKNASAVLCQRSQREG